MTEATTTGEQLVTAFAAGRLDDVLGLLADDATFRSPVAEYRGRERFGPVLRAVGRVLEHGSVTGVGTVAGETVAVVRADVEGRPVDGVLRVVAPADGPATEVTLLLRPLAALLAGVERMKALVAG